MKPHIAREFLSLLEAVFSKTRSFSVSRPTTPHLAMPAQIDPSSLRYVEAQAFIGVVAEDAYVERLAAD
jgi:hypothetical protein